MRMDFLKRRRSDAALRPRAPLKVLIVDDELAVCKFVDQVLRGAGHDTKIAWNASSALAMIERFGAFDLLLTDVVMPHVHGHELASRTRQIDPDIKVLYLTGYSDLLFKEKPMLWEGEAYLDKPVTGEALLEAIAHLMS
jgi:two-component system cell cycle sensor histidine kinase/response regulator CckA